MHLEEAMKHEVLRLEGEIANIDRELEKLHHKIDELITTRKKKEHDLKALKASFGESFFEEELIGEILKERQTIKL